MAADTAKLEEIRKETEKRGIEFFFAQFVDMYAPPSAKLVPAANLDDLVDGRRRLRRLRRRRDRPGAERPRHRRDPRPRQLHAGAVAAEPRALRLRHHRRRRGVAVLPAHDPAATCSRRRREQGYEFKIGLELEYFLVELREDGSIEIADPHDTLEKPCYDMDGLTRRYDFLTTVSQLLQRARLGQLRQRPRGRERPVRAELHLRRRARQLRPRDLLPLHGAHARRAARDGRDLHAEAVHAPDRQRLPLPHVALARRREPLPRRERPARARPLRDSPTTSSAA